MTITYLLLDFKYSELTIPIRANKFNNKDKKRIYPKNYLYILIGIAVFIILMLILV